MNIASRRVITGVAVALAFSAPIAIRAQLPTNPVERARVIAEIVQNGARQITIFDRQGKAIGTVGTRDMYAQPALSPDATRLAIVKADIDKETNDVYVLEIPTGKSTRITTSTRAREGAAGPVWSPDGRQIAYVALREGRFSIYRRDANGEGAEELLYQSNTPVQLTDWSNDGRFLGYSFSDLQGGAIYALPLDGDRKPIEIYRAKKQLNGVRFSPDSRFVSYISNESDRNEVYVRRFDPSNPGAAAGGPWKISEHGTRGLAAWHRGGKELYYVAADQSVIAVGVTSDATTPFSQPTVLFRAPEAMPIGPGVMSISADGARIAVAVPPSQLRQLTVLDRQGKTLRTPGQPGLYVQPGVSPDGTRAVVMRNDPQTGNGDIWTFDLTSGKGTAITNDTPPENAPIWSPDGKYVAYVSTREGYAGIYRKAADGTGAEELLFRYTPGAGMVLTDWSADGRFLTFSSGALLLVDLDPKVPALERKAIEWLREEYDVVQGRFSPDGRYIAFLSNEADGETMDVYVRAFDAGKPEAPAGPAIRVSNDGALGMIFWRQDSKEMYFLTPTWDVMAIDVSTTPTFKAGTPTRLFKLSGPLVGNPRQWKNVSRDGQQFVFVMSAAPSTTSR